MAARKSKKELIDEETLERAAECLRIVAHPHRLRIIELLLREEHSVGELAEICGLAPAVTSEHLRLMQRMGLLNSVREGRCIYYHVVEPHLEQIIDCVRCQFGSKTY